MAAEILWNYHHDDAPRSRPAEDPEMTTDATDPDEQTSDKDVTVAEEPDALWLHLARDRQEGKRIGVVPTMGALHAGHLSLIEAARGECDVVVVTIFVNPMQFGPHEDFDRYPRPLEEDIQRSREQGVDLIFHPSREVLYPRDFDTAVEVGKLSTIWEGRHRPGHFRGVTTVVLKLFNIVEPHVAYFGQKDYQQQALIRRMCRDLNLPVEIRTCPTVRDADGLALSSRNQYLSPEERQSALGLSQCLTLAREMILAGETDLAAVREEMRNRLESTKGVVLDYFTIADAETLEELSAPKPKMVALVAAHVGKTRLIDNMPIELESSAD